MKNKISLFLVISAFLIFMGCSKNVPVNSGIVRTSEPLHIMKFPQDKLISVNFTNTSTTDSNLTQVVIQHLRADGFKVVNKSAANVQIGGNLNYFRKADFSRRSWDNPRFSFGMGFGRYYRYTGVGVGWGMPFGYDPWDDDDYYRDYFYDSQISLYISVKNKGAWKDYVTNLNYQSIKNPGSKDSVMDALNFKIYEYIRQMIKQGR